MNAGEAARAIAPFVGLSYPNDSQKLFRMIKLACNKAHQSGTWFRGAAEFFIRIFRDEHNRPHIITPKSHNILLAATIGGSRPLLRDKIYMFHRNNYADAHMVQSNGWNPDIYDLGLRPTLAEYDFQRCEPYLIGVRGLGKPEPGAYVIVQGTYEDSRPVYSYENITTKPTICESGCAQSVNRTEIIHGLKIAVTDQFNYIDNVCISSIQSITKNHTNVPVEVVAIHRNGSVTQLAILEPYETQSKYRDYLVPATCCVNDIAHVLCKVSEQEDLTSESQSLIIDNEEAIIALCKGVQLTYFQEKPADGLSYFQQGIAILEGQKRQQEPFSNHPIQVDFIGGYNEIPPIIQRHS